MSEALFEKAKKFIPGGVNSPVRAFASVGGAPIFVSRANGPYVYDNEGKEHIDFIGSWGPMIFGHNHPSVKKAVLEAAKKGMSFGASTEAEINIAEKICEIVPSMEMVRLVNSGTEATMSAVRLARGYTGKDLIIKFRGCYHGHGDSFLIEAGSGALTFGQPSSPGVTKGTAQDTLLADYNDLDSVKALFEKYPDNIAGLIVEGVPGNMGVVVPALGFLEGLRKLCDDYEAVFIMDEVMSGFRVSLQGAQGLYNIKPDLTTMGKIIGGGLPVGAYGGKREIMEKLSPAGPVYQAGTLSGNPLATAAGLAALNEISKPGFYENLESKAKFLADGLESILKESSIPFCLNRVGSMLTVFFTSENVVDYKTATSSDTELFAKWFRANLAQGILLPPSQFEALFVGTAHSEEILNQTLEKMKLALKSLN